MKIKTVGLKTEMREMKLPLWHALSARMVLLALCAGVALSVCAESDKVTLVNKTVKSGKITKDDKDGLEIELSDGKGGGGARQTFTSADIADVDWDSSAEGFHEGVTAFRRGAYSSAAESFQSILDQKEVLTMSAIARKMGHTTAAASGLVARLENLGYVVRSSVREDRRKVMVCITPKGSALVTRIRTEMVGNLVKILHHLTPGEQKSWLHVYSKIYNYCQSRNDDSRTPPKRTRRDKTFSRV